MAYMRVWEKNNQNNQTTPASREEKCGVPLDDKAFWISHIITVHNTHEAFSSCLILFLKSTNETNKKKTQQQQK